MAAAPPWPGLALRCSRSCCILKISFIYLLNRPNQVKQQTAIIQKNIDQIGQTSDIVSEAFDLVESYETTAGPLFMNQTTRGGFPRKPAGGLELDRAMFAIQQGLIDHAFTPGNLKKFNEVLNGAAFKTS